LILSFYHAEAKNASFIHIKMEKSKRFKKINKIDVYRATAPHHQICHSEGAKRPWESPAIKMLRTIDRGDCHVGLSGLLAMT
jgi:hypothetical protein